MKPLSLLFGNALASLRRVRLARVALAGLLGLSVLGAGCTKLVSQETQNLAGPQSLQVWGVIDDDGAYQAAIKGYQAQYPNVTIDFRRLNLEDYETELVNAMAEDRGPDIFLIHHDWVGKYLTKIDPMPAQVRVARREVQGSVKKEVIWSAVTIPLLTNREYTDQFVDAVVHDTIRNINVSTTGGQEFRDRIIGIPTFVDTLALYYNRSLLNVAGIPLPPETWDDFQADVRRLTKLDARDPSKIVQSAAAIGMGSNVERSPDILTALMMQNGAVMSTPAGDPTFQLIPLDQSDAEEPPAAGALRFYAEFADPTKDVYTWNADQTNSLEAFIQGKTAFFFGYAYQQDLIKARAPQLNLGITKLPQITGRPPQNVANYWLWTVSKRSKYKDHAWNFLNFLAKHDQQQKISEEIGRPSPRRDVLADQLRNEQIGVFASQVLTSHTWYRGRNPKAMEQAFITMMDKVAKKEANIEDAIKYAVEQVGQSY